MAMIIIARGGEVKLALPKAEIKPDGTIWQSGMPLLGINDQEEKKRITKLVKAGKFTKIPSEYFTKLGDNSNGLWAGTREEWQTRPEKIAGDLAAEERKREESKIVKIYLSSRGWGDYSACEWRGNITRPTEDILAECRTALETGYDVDKPNQTDEEILEAITQAKIKWEEAPARIAANRKAEAEDIQKKIDSGYCFYCESWCHGDCGHFSSDPGVKFRRDLKTAIREENYGINEG